LCGCSFFGQHLLRCGSAPASVLRALLRRVVLQASVTSAPASAPRNRHRWSSAASRIKPSGACPASRRLVVLQQLTVSGAWRLTDLVAPKHHRLTSHSSRNRFAVRLNSGVRPAAKRELCWWCWCAVELAVASFAWSFALRGLRVRPSDRRVAPAACGSFADSLPVRPESDRALVAEA